jgi:hypothetical protein
MPRTLPLCLLATAMVACVANPTSQPMPTPTLPDCVPTLDGMIAEAQLPIALGATIDFYTATNTPVDLVASNNVWNLAQQYPNEQDSVATIGPVELDAQWYAGNYPSGEFVVDAGNGLDGIYHQDDIALWLDGTASQVQNPAAGETLIVYPEPIAVLRFPITVGQTFTSVGQLASATIDGLPFVGMDQVAVDVDASGELQLPYVNFSPALQVQTLVTRTPSTGSPVLTTRTTTFMFECFGEIARAESNLDEPNANFTTAAYLRRYALGE